jgi:hypothetical protein
MTEESNEITEELMKEVDKTTLDPGQRAQKVLLILRQNKELTNWDILCFAVEYMGLMSLQQPILMKAAQVITKWLYIAHYVNHGFIEFEKKE